MSLSWSSRHPPHGSSTFAIVALLLIIATIAATAGIIAARHAWTAPVPEAPTPASVLRVCADPNNLPFSNEAGEGFENALAELVAADLDGGSSIAGGRSAAD